MYMIYGELCYRMLPYGYYLSLSIYIYIYVYIHYDVCMLCMSFQRSFNAGPSAGAEVARQLSRFALQTQNITQTEI